MQDACGLMSFYFKPASLEAIERFYESLQLIMMAVSWSGHENLIIPKCAGIVSGDFDATNRDHRMMRLYVGLEDVDYLNKVFKV